MDKYFFTNKLFKNTIKLTGGSVVNYLIPIVTTPILTRIYSPNDYGEWGVFSSWVTILTVFVCGGYEYAIVESQQREVRSKITQICFLISLVLNFLLYLFILLLSIIDINLFNVSSPYLIPVYLLFTALTAILQNYCNASELYAKLSMFQILSGVSLALFRILFGILEIPNGLIYGAIMSLIVPSLYLLIGTGVYSIFKFKCSFDDVKKIIVEYKNYPLFDAPSTFLVFLSNNIPILVLSSVYGKDLLGCYTMVLQLLLLPMSFIGSNMGKVFFQQLSAEPDKIQSISCNVYKLSFLLGASVIVFFILGGDILLYIFLGEKWQIASAYSLFLALWAFSTISFAPLKPVYRVKRKQNVQIRVVLLSFFFQCIVLVFCSSRKMDLAEIILIYSITCSIFKLLEGYVLLRYCNNVSLLVKAKYLVPTIIIIFIWSLRCLFSIN